MIPTRLGSLIILLTATIVGAGVWWYMNYYTEIVDVDEIVEQIQEEQEVKNELPSEYRIAPEYGVVYYRYTGDFGEIVLSSDIENFEFLGGIYAKDKNNVYARSILVTGVDIETFVVLTDYMAKDQYQAYAGSSPIKEADLTSFEVVEGMISKDKNNVFFGGESLEGIDSATIQFVNERYIKDKNGVYYILERYSGAKQDQNMANNYRNILNADKGTFIFFPESPCYAYDKNNVYYGDIIIQNADVHTFRLFVSTYMPNGGSTQFWPLVDFYIDKNNLLKMNREDANHLIPNVDIETLEFVTPGSYSFYFKDKNNLYWLKDGETDVVIINHCNYCLEREMINDCFPSCREGGPACLATGTKILMTNGNYKNIENIKVGDLVTSYEIKTKEYTISKVDKVIKRKDPLVIINNTLRTAPDEPVYLADGRIKEVTDIKVGDYLVNEKGEQVKVNTVEQNPELVDTYDFTLENGNNFFAAGYLVGTPEL